MSRIFSVQGRLLGSRMTLLLLFGCSFSLFAEPRTKKNKTSDERPKQEATSATTAAPSAAHVRVWKDVFESNHPTHVIIRPGSKKAVPIDLELPVERQFMDYQEISPGIVTVEVSDDSNPKTKVGSKQIVLTESGFFTVLLREINGQLSIESIDDTSRSDSVGELTVRNFAPDLTSLQLKVGEALTANLAPQNAFVQIRGFARELSHIETSGLDKAGRPVSWANEVDFQKFKKATLLIFPDAFGRIRPRLIIDGENAAPGEDPK